MTLYDLTLNPSDSLSTDLKKSPKIVHQNIIEILLYVCSKSHIISRFYILQKLPQILRKSIMHLLMPAFVQIHNKKASFTKGKILPDF